MIKEVLIRQRVERDDISGGSYVPRTGAGDARRDIGNGLIKVITGPRRAGKSIFALQMLQGNDFAYVNFDDERLVALEDYTELEKAINQVYRDAKIIFFDEIQNLKSWELFVNRLARAGRFLVLSGSNANLLGRELATHLTGRFQEYRVLPFSFLEFCLAKGVALGDAAEIKERQGTLLSWLDEYLMTGGYPEVVVKGIDPKGYLGTLFESILFKDVVKRYGVRYPGKLADLGRYLLSNHAREYSLTSLKNILDFGSVHTVDLYLKYLMEVFLLYSVDRFSYKAKERLKAPKKIYAYDNGFVNAMKFKTGRDSGWLLENLVAVELMRRREEIHYYKDQTGKEVDFVIRRGGGTAELLQVCYDPSDPLTRKREIRAFLKAQDTLHCRDGAILTWDIERAEIVSKRAVRFMPVWKWLIPGEH